MKWFCLLLPACVSMKIRYRRNGNKLQSDNMLVEIFRWGSWVLLDNLITIFTVLYLLGYGSLTIEVFDSFGFALKYAMISLFFACVIPYILEIIEKYFKISFTVGEAED